MSRKENIFFYDEQLYRFSLYYEDHDWWFRNGFNACKQCLQSNIISLIFQLLKLKPKYVIFLHRSNRVFFLASLANLLGIKVIFWQHGFFAYPAQRKFPYSLLNPKIDHLLYLSNYDKEKLIVDFRNTQNTHHIKHYDVERILKNKLNGSQINILYIGQIIFKDQLLSSESNPWIQRNIKNSSSGAQELLEKILGYISKNKKYKLFIKKHPGDKSNYIDKQIESFNSTLLGDKDLILPDIVVSHFSTLAIAYIQLGVPTVLLPHGLILDTEIDFSHYGDYADSPTFKEFIDFIKKAKKHKKIDSFESKSISKILLDIIS